jgi:hypothetical protein
MADSDPGEVVIPDTAELRRLKDDFYRWMTDLSTIRVDVDLLKITPGSLPEADSLRKRFEKVKGLVLGATEAATIDFMKMGDGIFNVALVYEDNDAKNGDDVESIRGMVDAISKNHPDDQNLPKTVPPPEPPPKEAPPKEPPPKDSAP